jgi:hypothetical protein
MCAVGGLCKTDRMATESRHLAERIERTADEVYAYAADPAHLPEWASGLGSGIEQVDGRWFTKAGDGSVEIAFAPRNEFGVLDHYVTLPSGESIYVPMRVVADGEASEVVFTLRRLEGMTDEELARDEAAVVADLARLKAVIERRS